MEKIYYTYIYLDPRKPGHFSYQNINQSFLYEPFYIGKGKGNRLYSHLKVNRKLKRIINQNKYRYRIIKKILKNNLKPVIFKIQENLTNEKASEFEKFLIKNIGRKDLKRGPLVNHTDGGDGGSTNKGKKLSQEHKDKLSKARKGRRLTEENKKRISETLKGKKLSQETKDKMKIAQKLRRQEERDGKRKRQNYLIGENHPMHRNSLKNIWIEKYGNDVAQQKDLEWKNKLSKVGKGRKISEKHKKILSDKLKGKSGKIGPKNGMYGRSLKSVWIEKYGEEIAEQKHVEWRNKLRKH